MNERRFSFDSEEWEVDFDGVPGARASSYLPSEPVRFGVTFHNLSDSMRPDVRGQVSASDPHTVSHSELQEALRVALALAAMGRRRPRPKRKPK